MLSQDDQVKAGTDHYIDDIWINERVVVAERVKELLQRYGLVAKEPKSLENTCMLDRKSTRLNSSHVRTSRMPSSA